MKKKWICILMALALGLCAGCGAEDAQSENSASASELEISELAEGGESTESSEEEGRMVFGTIASPTPEELADRLDGDGAEAVTDEQAQAEQKAAWGLTLTAENVTAKGLTIVCTQAGGEVTGELETGSWYTVQRLVNGAWETVEYTEIDEDQVGWTAEAWFIPLNDTTEWKVDWTWLYGELPAGEYRIGKEIVDFREAGDYDEAVLYTEFTIG